MTITDCKGYLDVDWYACEDNRLFLAMNSSHVKRRVVLTRTYQLWSNSTDKITSRKFMFAQVIPAQPSSVLFGNNSMQSPLSYSPNSMQLSHLYANIPSRFSYNFFPFRLTSYTYHAYYSSRPSHPL